MVLCKVVIWKESKIRKRKDGFMQGSYMKRKDTEPGSSQSWKRFQSDGL